MEDREDVRLVVVHLRVVDLGQAVLDGQGMEMERVLEDRRFLHRRVLEVDPVDRVRDLELLGVELQVLDLAVQAPEVGQHPAQSPTGFSSSAWAAARRAMGTR